eukprot:7379565-Prymnesium_polylepis.1
MRGKVCDMDRVLAICDAHGLTLVEDCAHGCGVKYNGRQLGYHAKVSCYSTQSDKVINSGEGGFITTDDDALMAKAIYYSGAYEARYAKHTPHPPKELCEEAMLSTPNLSCRMSELTAAVMRPLIANLPERVERYNARYALVVGVLRALAGHTIVVPEQLPQVEGVGDHLNFYLHGVSAAQNARFMKLCADGGVPVSWFCSSVNARWHVNWRKYGAPTYELPQTDGVLSSAYDLKLPPHFEDRCGATARAASMHAAERGCRRAACRERARACERRAGAVPRAPLVAATWRTSPPSSPTPPTSPSAASTRARRSPTPPASARWASNRDGHPRSAPSVRRRLSAAYRPFPLIRVQSARRLSGASSASRTLPSDPLTQGPSLCPSRCESTRLSLARVHAWIRSPPPWTARGPDSPQWHRVSQACYRHARPAVDPRAV